MLARIIGIALLVVLQACGGGSNAASAPSAPASNAGALSMANLSVAVAQNVGSAALTVTRSGGSSGAASVHFVTTDGTALAGSDYSASSGVLQWVDADATAKTIVIPVSTAAPFVGTRTFVVTLSAATGGSLGAQLASTVSVSGSGSGSGASCAQTPSSWVSVNDFDYKQFGNYTVNNDNWNHTLNQVTWANDQSCWGVATAATQPRDAPTSFPDVTRGWSPNATLMQQLSTPETFDWTTKSGMGILVTKLTKNKVHWSFVAPTSTGSRWMALMDTYFHSTPTPSPNDFHPFIDLMVDAAIMDSVLVGQAANTSTYYSLVASGDHATTVTLGGGKYLVYVDDAAESAYHLPGGHSIHLFALPTTYTDSIGPSWGSMNSSHDFKAIIDYFRQSNPKDDAGKALLFADGTTVAAPLISDNLYLTSITAGFEINLGTEFKNTAFCVAMQNEPDCP